MKASKSKPSSYKYTAKSPDWTSSVVQEAPAEMRTNIVMEEPLVAEAQAITGITTKTGVVHFALRELVRRQKMKEALRMRGKVDFWDGYAEEHVKP